MNMKTKKIILILIAIILCVMIVLIVKRPWEKNEATENNEITPAEEMTEEQERQTMISLYYTNIETNTLVPEARVIDAKNLLENPYKTLIEYLIEVPKNEKLKSSLPEGTKVNSAILNGDTVVLDLSSEFIQNQNASLSIYAIANTLTELNEVNYVQILINGESDKQIEGTEVNLSEKFSKKI